MPNSRIVFDDNMQVISPLAESMARLGKTLAYDIPKMKMDAEERDYQRGQNAARMKMSTDAIEYQKGRDAANDTRVASDTAFNHANVTADNTRQQSIADANLKRQTAQDGIAAQDRERRINEENRKRSQDSEDRNLKLATETGVVSTQQENLVIAPTPQQQREYSAVNQYHQSQEAAGLKLKLTQSQIDENAAQAIARSPTGGVKTGTMSKVEEHQVTSFMSQFGKKRDPQLNTLVDRSLSEILADPQAKASYDRLGPAAKEALNLQFSDASAKPAPMDEQVLGGFPVSSTTRTKIDNMMSQVDRPEVHPLDVIDPSIVDEARPDWPPEKRARFKRALMAASTVDIGGDSQARHRVLREAFNALMEGSDVDSRMKSGGATGAGAMR